ncbi:Hypothetical protein AA314_05593 [Archangium gephyra]|uniref:Uncharacterized protein n=1 Tax=Archangium gephyra TaxID=48 RepID=A0AAC8QA66_9BACT|nr:Hypothetical protein AA314_05593 [Archangium gephyra]
MEPPLPWESVGGCLGSRSVGTLTQRGGHGIRPDHGNAVPRRELA